MDRYTDMISFINFIQKMDENIKKKKKYTKILCVYIYKLVILIFHRLPCNPFSTENIHTLNVNQPKNM